MPQYQYSIYNRQDCYKQFHLPHYHSLFFLLEQFLYKYLRHPDMLPSVSISLSLFEQKVIHSKSIDFLYLAHLLQTMGQLRLFLLSFVYCPLTKKKVLVFLFYFPLQHLEILKTLFSTLHHIFQQHLLLQHKLRRLRLWRHPLQLRQDQLRQKQ